MLELGVVEVDVATMMPMEPERGSRYAGPVLAFLVRLSDGRNVLVDTGLAPAHLENPEVRIKGPSIVVHVAPENQLLYQLEQIGLRLDDISAVVNTHFDFDHCGANSLFPHAGFIVQREHYDWSLANRDRLPATPDWNVEGLKYRLLDGDAHLFDGVEAVVTSGHAPGHQSVIVRLPDSGTMILAGDAAHTHVMFEEERVAGTPDAARARASIRRLKAIRDEEAAEVFVCHDTDALRTKYRIAPNYYT